MESKNTPLIIAAKQGDLESVRSLLAEGSDVNAIGDKGWTALMRTIVKGNTGIVKALLDAGADVNLKGLRNRYTALMLASRAGHPDMVSAMLDAGAEVNAKNKYGDTALRLANERGHKEIADLLKAYSAER